MQILAISAVAASVALVAAYGFSRLGGPSIQTRIEIAAPAARVWQVLSETDTYPQWNPFVRNLSGDLRVGSRLELTVQPPGRAPMNFTPTVLAARPDAELRWLGRIWMPGIFDGEHSFVIEKTGESTATLHHSERFTGLLAYPLLALIGRDTRAGFEAMNAALKERAELAKP